MSHNNDKEPLQFQTNSKCHKNCKKFKRNEELNQVKRKKQNVKLL